MHDIALRADRYLRPTRKPIQLFSALFLMDLIKGFIMELTQKKLKQILRYDKNTGIFTNRIFRCSQALKGNRAGHQQKDGYNRIRLNNKLYKSSRLAYLYVKGYFPEGDVDNRDQNKYNDKWSNLRETSRICNVRNSGNRVDNKSGVKGVIWKELNQKWEAYVTVNQKRHYLGIYKDFANAVCARLAAEQCLNWSNCESTSPAFLYVKNNFQINK